MIQMSRNSTSAVMMLVIVVVIVSLSFREYGFWLFLFWILPRQRATRSGVALLGVAGQVANVCGDT